MKKRIRLLLSRLIVSDKTYYKLFYFLKFKKRLNLKNPITANEKIFKLMLTQKAKKLSTFADKYLVRKYVKEKVGEQHLIPLIHHTTDVNTITHDILKNGPVIIKTNHLSGPPLTIVRDDKELDLKSIKKEFKRSLRKNYYYSRREPHYKHITPRIIVEKLLLDKEGKIPKDFKFHVFNKKVEFIQVDYDRFINHKRNYYSRDWELLPFQWSPFKKGKFYENALFTNESSPKNLKECIQLAEKISPQVPYCRVDLYNEINNIFFGEITFFHEAGIAQFSNPEWELKVGKLIQLGLLEKCD